MLQTNRVGAGKARFPLFFRQANGGGSCISPPGNATAMTCCHGDTTIRSRVKYFSIIANRIHLTYKPTDIIF